MDLSAEETKMSPYEAMVWNSKISHDVERENLMATFAVVFPTTPWLRKTTSLDLSISTLTLIGGARSIGTNPRPVKTIG